VYSGGMITAHKTHGGLYNIVFNSDPHTYSIAGALKPSATGVVDVLDKPALVRWSANCAADEFRKLMKPGVSLDELQIEQIAKAAAKAHVEIRDSAGDLGSLVHTWIHKFVLVEMGERKKKPAMPQNPEARLCVEGFLKFHREVQPTYLWSERILYNKELDICGTADIGMDVPGYQEFTLGDWKTSGGIWPGYAMQVEFYRRCVIEEEANKKHNRWLTSNRMLIHLPRDGSFQIYDEIDLFSMTGNDKDGDWEGFKGAAAALRWKQKNPGRWRGRK